MNLVPKFDLHKDIIQDFHIYNNDRDKHDFDMIIGKYLLNHLDFQIDYLNKTII